MPMRYCFLCASDEGVFLDITSDNLTSLSDQLEACLSTKQVNKTINLSSKICYKCAYELEQCSKFIRKCKKSHEDLKHSSAKEPVLSCCLCFEYVEGGHFFDITKDRTIFNPLQKIRNIFNEDITKKNCNSTLICLTCRYNLDVLYDLKKLYRETSNLKAPINQEIDYSTFPKVYTDVVNRKTTISIFPSDTIFMLLSSDSDNNKNMARKTRNRKRSATKPLNIAKSKKRICDECRNVVGEDHDMYRFHRTGLTVCKSCWMTMDPTKSKVIRRSQNNSTETKPCTVFLKDVLNEGSYKSEKQYNLRSDKDDNKLFVISNDSSDEDGSLDVSPNVQSSTINSGARRGKKRQIDATRSNDETSTPSEFRRNTRHVKQTKFSKASSDIEQSSINSSKQHEYNTRGIRNNVRNSDSDILRLALKTIDESDDHVKRHLSSDSEEENTEKISRKILRSAYKETPVKTYSQLSDESSSNESGPNLRTKRARKSSTTSVTSTSRMEIENKKETRSRTRSSSSVSSKEMTPPVEFKSPKLVASSEAKTEYSCDKCDKKFTSKLLSAEHGLIHLKQATLKLERINILNDEQEQTKIDTEENKILKETEAHFDGNTPTEKQTDDPSEEIAITIDDDTDDEEIFSVSTNQNATELGKKEQHNEDNDDNNGNDNDNGKKINDKQNVTESEPRSKEESTKTQNDEQTVTKEFQQCENSTDVPAEAITPSEKKEDENIQKDAETLTSKSIDTSKNNDSQEVIVTIAENDADLNVKKNETEKEDNDIKIAENESVNECNNDKENICGEITQDDEIVELSVSTINKNNNDNITKSGEDHDKSFTQDLENTRKNDRETDVEICDTIDDSQMKDTKKSEEEEHTTDFVNDLKTLKNTKVTDDAIGKDDAKVEDSEKHKNGINKQNKEIEVIIDDKSSSSRDSIKSDISNCKEVDKMEDNTDRDDIAVLIDNDDDHTESVESKKITEKTITTNDSAEKRKLGADIDDFDLLENDVASRKCEMQEKSISSSSDNSPMNTSNEILKEVFDLAAAEVQKREDTNNKKTWSDEMETLENISREIRNSADMPSLDPISVIEEDDDNDVNLT